jgi:probable rRNA maturation factor
MTQVDIQNLTTLSIDEDFVRRLVKKTLQYGKIKGTISVGVVFVGRARIQKLNRKYKGKNKATDVLSFQSERKFITPKIKGTYLGEIVVCPAVVKSQAAMLGIPSRREFSHVIIHGILHLLGWEHDRSAKDTRKMHAKEEEIMRLWPMK